MDSLIAFAIIVCMVKERISIDIIADNCNVSLEEAQKIIDVAKNRRFVFCEGNLEIEMPVIVSYSPRGFNLDQVCIINGNMKLDGSGLLCNVEE